MLADVYPAGEAPITAADSRSLAHAIRVLGKTEPIYAGSVEEVPAVLMNILKDGDIVLNMGAGNINKLPALLKAFQAA